MTTQHHLIAPEGAPKEQYMSVKDVLDTIGADVVSAYRKLTADTRKVKQAWLILSSSETRAVVLKLGADAIKLVKDATPAVQAGGFNLPLDAAVVSDIQAIIADAKAGDGVLRADLQALGIQL